MARTYNPSREPASLLALNRGLMSRLGVARVDLKRTGLAAETMTNWMPRVLGSMSLRPGFEYVGASYGNSAARLLPFVYATDDSAMVELTDSLLRVWVDDELVTRASVSTAVSNGTFDTDLTGWTDADESGATSAWATGGYLSLIGTGSNAAIRTQTLTVAAGDQNVEHALRVVVTRGPVTFRVGSAAGGDQYISERTLRTGTHSITFTPTGAAAYVQVKNVLEAASLVSEISVEAAGTMTLPTPYAAADLSKVRVTQSADVVFIACEGYQQMRLERWSETGWSLVKYEPKDGPFRLINITQTTLAPSALVGDITLTASKSLFRSTHVGGLFKISSTGQIVTASATGADQFTDPIVVTGVGGERRFAHTITGTFVGTVTLQYSVAEPGSWVDVDSWTTAGARNYSDDLDGQIIYYRIGIKAGDYTSGTAALKVSISSGSITGIARVTGYTSETVVSAAVLKDLGGTTASTDWWEGAWSSRRGWPSAVALYEGRVWWFGKSNCWASISDAYDSFDEDQVGDSGPVSRSIGEGPVDSINWAMPMQRMVLGTDNAELSVRSSSFDEPITPTNFSIKFSSTQGSKQINAARVDTLALFVQRGGQRIYSIGYDLNQNEYTNEDMTALVPDLGEGGFNFITAQRQPDTRIHAVRADGSVAVLVFDRTEDVMAWCLVETDGTVEDVCVLPGTGEDRVYYLVNRTINGSTVRYIEKWAKESECRGGTTNKQADSFLSYSGVSTASISGLSHLEGETVVAWGAGKDLGSYTVSSGSVTLSESVTAAIVGLPYTAQFKSMKQAVSQALAVPMNQRARISQLGLVLADTHRQGIEFGPDFDNLDNLPLVEDEATVADDYVWEAYDKDFTDFPGEWTTDARICLQATAPRPCTVLAVQAIIAQNPR